MSIQKSFTPTDGSLLGAFDGETLMADLDALGAIGLEPERGLQRMAYSAADMEGRRWVLAQMEAVGMAAHMDPAGNVVGIYPGAEDLPALALGSHTDSVPGGGKYDGSLGVLGALACVRTLHQQGVRLRHPLLVIDFAAEEATTAACLTGSLSFVSGLTPQALAGPAWDGRSTVALLADAGFAVDRMVANCPPLPLAAFLELHIEQGERLVEAGVPIGVVTGVVGIRRYYVTFLGQTNHAGTTGMERRRDALVMAGPFITTVRNVAVAHAIVGTIGRIEVHPGASNVIPGCVVLDVEIRSMDNRLLEAAEVALRDAAAAQDGQFAGGHHMQPVPAAGILMEAIERASTDLGLAHMRLPSGAGHDAMNMARICPFGMIFVPSEGGISHAPDEFTKAEHCIDGGRVLLATLLQLDREL